MPSLYPFQEKAVDKLFLPPSVIIADDMGLGKTVEAIALDKRRRDSLGPSSQRVRTLVIAPMSVLSVWEDHFAEWQPSLKVIVIDRKNRFFFERAVQDNTHDVYIMHWDVVRLVDAIKKVPWFHVIADEAHRIGSKDTQVTIHAKKIQHRYLTQLTGTPCTTRPQQFWSLLNWAYPKVFTSYWRFYNHHVITQQHDANGNCLVPGCGKYHKSMFRVIIGVAHEDELQAAIGPYYVRRLKEDVLKDLPDKYYSTIKVDLEPQQRRVYNQMRDEMLAWIGAQEDQPLAAPAAIAKLVRLQQLSCAFAKIEMVKVRKRDSNNGGYIEFDKQRVTLIDPSVKLDVVMEVLDANPSRQFVIFSQSKQVINLLAGRLCKADISYGIFTGDTPQSDRGSMVDDFQMGKLRVFASTIATGGVGITLTAASTCIFLDRSWSPAINRQAEDRLHRLGQRSAVQIIDIIARDTVDLGRLQRLEQSWQFIKRLLGDRDAKTKPEGAYI
jgi:SNF2 family DNA or RNA helicase